ncbi:MAG TPA: DUF4235 domain-containing protein [Solirubrobacteraceae bacterium]
MFLLRLLYKPFAILSGLIAARIGKKLFSGVWSKIDDQPPPRPGRGDGSVGKVIAAQALQAGVMAAAAAAVDRGFATVFHHLIGIWPKKPPTPADDEQS